MKTNKNTKNKDDLNNALLKILQDIDPEAAAEIIESTVKDGKELDNKCINTKDFKNEKYNNYQREEAENPEIKK
jgi:hypothetical protein